MEYFVFGQTKQSTKALIQLDEQNNPRTKQSTNKTSPYCLIGRTKQALALIGRTKQESMHSSTLGALLLVLLLASGGRSYIPHDHPHHFFSTGLCFVPRGAVRGRVHTKQQASSTGVPLCRNDLSQVHMQEASGGRPGGGIPGDGQRASRSFRYVALPM